MFFRHGLDKLIYPLIAGGILIFASYRPTYHLRADMPPEFSAMAGANPKSKEGLDARIAWAYWESAQMDIQWKYPHGHPLPVDPPAEFHVQAAALGPAASDPAIRQLYWHRLQQVWYSPETWKREYEWSVGWASDPLTSTGQWIREKTAQLFRID
jgi:hypothetical protein